MGCFRLSKCFLLQVNHIFVISKGIIHFLIMQQTNSDLPTDMASYGHSEAMTVRRYPFIYFWLKKSLSIFNQYINDTKSKTASSIS